MKWESIMQQLHVGLHILPPQYSPAEPRLATVDVDFACYKQKEMQIKGNFPFSHGQRTWHSTGNTALWLNIHGLPYIITNRPIEKIRNENNLLQIKRYIIRLSSWFVMIKKKKKKICDIEIFETFVSFVVGMFYEKYAFYNRNLLSPVGY